MIRWPRPRSLALPWSSSIIIWRANLPEAHAVINPNRHDDLSGFGYLCAAGVTMILIAAVNRLLRQRAGTEARPEPNMLQWLELVALATVCDVVPLIGLNRAYVTQGLKIMARRQNLGLAALADVARLKSRPDAMRSASAWSATQCGRPHRQCRAGARTAGDHRRGDAAGSRPNSNASTANARRSRMQRRRRRVR